MRLVSDFRRIKKILIRIAMKKILLALCMLPMAFAATSMSSSSVDNYEERCQAVLAKTSQSYAKERGERMESFLKSLNNELKGVTKLAPGCDFTRSGLKLGLEPPNLGMIIERMKDEAVRKVNEACENARSQVMQGIQGKLGSLNKGYSFAGQRVGINAEVRQ